MDFNSMHQILISLPPEQIVKILTRQQKKIVVFSLPKIKPPFIVNLACYHKRTAILRDIDRENDKIVYTLYQHVADTDSRLTASNSLNNKVVAKFVVRTTGSYKLIGGEFHYLYIYDPHKIFVSQAEKNKLFTEDYLGKLEENPRGFLNNTGFTAEEFLNYKKNKSKFFMYYIDFMKTFPEPIPIQAYALNKVPTGWCCVKADLPLEALSWDITSSLPKNYEVHIEEGKHENQSEQN